MHIKITSPADKNTGSEAQLKEAIAKFEEEFTLEENGCSYYHLVISGEYPRDTCDEIERIYRKAGWDATCKTSSENGERAGLTSLQLRIK